MKILLIEDNDQKKEVITSVIQDELKTKINNPEITYASELYHSIRELNKKQFDLVIFDMYLPETKESMERDCSRELISEFSESKNYQSEAITLTQYEINEVDDIQSFNLAGITLVKFDESNSWKEALKQKINRAAQKIKFDFLIFCSLPKERISFQETACTIGTTQNINGMDCLKVTIDDFTGLIIKPNAMGLVSMAIIASKAIELFQPKLISMSGICAGVKGESNYLDIIVGKTCWEYQTGKWKDGEFKQEPYQASLPRGLEVDLQQSSEDGQILEEVRKGLYCTELENMEIKVAPISSGSAVVSDEDMMQRIGTQHRKMAGLEMEMYSLYEAAEQSLCNPLFFGAKAVVDMGDRHKGDRLQHTGCVISARYTTLMLKEQLRKLAT